MFKVEAKEGLVEICIIKKKSSILQRDNRCPEGISEISKLPSSTGLKVGKHKPFILEEISQVSCFNKAVYKVIFF
jgi:hypothetical protein